MDSLTLKLLLRDEGFRRSAYADHLGYLTIGIGRMIDARKGGGLSFAEATYLLTNDVDERTNLLDTMIPWWKGLNRVRKLVLLSMSFQMGVDGLMLFRNTLKAVEEGRFDDAADGMVASKWARQTPLRASRLANAMRTGSEDEFQLHEDPPDF